MSSSLSQKRAKKPCAVCGVEGRCVGFAAIVCKSCSVFYRRSYKLRSILKCKRDGNCNLNHELRNVCRACRLQSCRNLGLRMVGRNLIVQCNGYPVDDVDEDGSATSSDVVPEEPCNGAPLVSNPDISMFPEIQRLVEAFVKFESSQRLISSIHQGKTVQGYEYLTKCLQYKMEIATLQAICEMIKNLLVDCLLTDAEMIQILKNAPIQLAISHKADLTNRVFPALGDTRIAFYVGYYLDLNKLEYFLNINEDFERMKKIAYPLLHKRFVIAERYRQVRPDSVEHAAFLGILIFEELTRIGVKNDVIARRQEALYAELFQYLLSIHHDPGVVSGRIIRIMSFIHEIKDVIAAIDEMYSVSDVFLENYRNTGWVNKPELPMNK